jgi:hypothetical protein
MGADREALVNTITSGNTFLKSGDCSVVWDGAVKSRLVACYNGCLTIQMTCLSPPQIKLVC